MAVPETSRPREDLAAALAARRELGEEYDDALIGGFLDRLDRSIDARVKSQVEERERASHELAQRDTFSLKLALGSLVLGIPLSAIAGREGLAGIVVAWGGIAVVNVAHALRDWRRR
jgi:anti-sigma factor RsiW